MKEIDTRRWGVFTLGGPNGIFKVVKGTRLTRADMREGTINYIGASALNNGITAKIGNDEALHPANTITVSYNGSVGQCFYQEKTFWASDDVNVLYPNFALSNNIAMFMLPIIKAISGKYAFANKWKKEQMETSTILLPVRNKKPDFAYMEKYVSGLGQSIKKSIDSLTKICMEKSNLAIEWRPFHLYDENLFEIDGGTKLDRVRMSDCNPSVNFVGRANANNGVTDFIDAIPGLEPYSAGLLTLSLGGEYLGSCFVQDKPFYTSQNVNVLIPKHPMSDSSKKFISTVIFCEGQAHYKAFSDELNRHIKRDFSILLPARKDGTPDFEYMETFMKKRESVVRKAIDSLWKVA